MKNKSFENQNINDIIDSYEKKVSTFFNPATIYKNSQDDGRHREEFYIPVSQTNLLRKWTASSKKLHYISVFENNTHKRYEDITEDNFTKWFDKDKISFEELLASYKKFINVYNKKRIQDSKLKNKTSLITSKLNSNKTITNLNWTDEYLEFYSTSFGRRIKYNEADDYFVFNRLYKDRQEQNINDTPIFYFKLNTETTPKYYALEFKNFEERHLSNNTLNSFSSMWSHFEQEFANDFERWERTIIDTVENYKIEDNPNKSLEEIICEKGVPVLFLQCVKIKITWRHMKVEKDKISSVENISLTYPIGDGTIQNRRIETFSKYLFRDIDVSRVRVLPLLSNDPSIEALHIRTLPKVTHTDLSKEPELPPHWATYLNPYTTPTGEVLPRFYDEKMDKMKIANLVYNTLNTEYTGRQMTVFSGEGFDGKSLLISVLVKILGEDLCTSLDPSSLEEGGFGLENLVGKKFLYFPDQNRVGSLFHSNIFKKLTGGDTISINRKYKSVINYRAKSLVIVVATNNPYSISNEHSLSRVIPLVNLKNFTQESQKDKDEMIVDLLSEKDEFIQWCVNYRWYMNEKYNRKLLFAGGNVLRVCKDDDLETELQKDDVSPTQLFIRACKNQRLKGAVACNYGDIENSDDIEDLYEPLFNELFEIDDSAQMTLKQMKTIVENKIRVEPDYMQLFDTKTYYIDMPSDDGKVFKKQVVSINHIGRNQKWQTWLNFMVSIMKVNNNNNNRVVVNGVKTYVFGIKEKEQESVFENKNSYKYYNEDSTEEFLDNNILF